MTTIGFKDLATGRNGIINCFFKAGQKKNERIKEAIKDLQTVGHIAGYLIKGNKQRLLFIKRY